MISAYDRLIIKNYIYRLSSVLMWLSDVVLIRLFQRQIYLFYFLHLFLLQQINCLKEKNDSIFLRIITQHFEFLFFDIGNINLKFKIYWRKVCKFLFDLKYRFWVIFLIKDKSSDSYLIIKLISLFIKYIMGQKRHPEEKWFIKKIPWESLGACFNYENCEMVIKTDNL